MPRMTSRMKSTCCLTIAVVLIIATSVQTDDSEDEKKELAKQMLRSMTEECMKQEGASEEDVEAILEDKTPETEVQKCFLSCCQQQFHISDGKRFDKEGFLELSRMMFKEDDEKMKIADEVGEECSTVENADRCQLSVDIKHCVETELEKRGIKMER